jgi:hypothetical protein
MNVRRPAKPIDLVTCIPYLKNKGYVNAQGYVTLTVKGKKVPKHRVVLYKKIGGGTHVCHHCDKPVTWDAHHITDSENALVGDHLDSDKLNNDPDNIVPSCNYCNATRTNQSIDVPITYNDETLLTSEWAQRVDIDTGAMKTRLLRWPESLAVTAPKYSGPQRKTRRPLFTRFRQVA